MVTVDNRDEILFPTVVEYMHARDVLRRINQFTVRAVIPTLPELLDDLRQGCARAPSVAGRSFHIFWLDGRLMWMKREVSIGTIFEKITLSCSVATRRCWKPSSTPPSKRASPAARQDRSTSPTPTPRRLVAGAAGQQPPAGVHRPEGRADGANPVRPGPLLRRQGAL
jgi:hypothetical protein